ncbi:MAG TPA: Flp family type IVb pilin [Aquabacterium sp.]|uniref:Flp family type IVb pilin n=1 Tax=Aquabacterium sp. TaxID=1872578 RepID=UPI002E320D61|nr:Flp family type IVb pilin [Aquabacterium sp.]HEX5372301.1 Flp family type IVb pilin [Aquabacterium sp.]
MKTLIKFFRDFASDESGATAIEYGLLAALISVVIIVAAALVGTNLTTLFQQVADCLGGGPGNGTCPGGA